MIISSLYSKKLFNYDSYKTIIVEKSSNQVKFSVYDE